MEELVERLVRWDLHPADIITHRFSLHQAAEALARKRISPHRRILQRPFFFDLQSRACFKNNPAVDGCNPRGELPLSFFPFGMTEMML
jgi:hypothetical protein